MFEVEVVRTLAHTPRQAWDDLFGGSLEGHDYLRAIETASLVGFDWRYVLVRRAGELVAAAPAFITDYPLETTFDGAGRKAAEQVRRVLPGLMTPRLACLGSPCTETATIGFTPSLSSAERLAAARALVAAFEREARVARCALAGVKDADPAQAALWGPVMTDAHYAEVPGQPLADLPIDFSSIDAYLERLSSGVRKDMRRKLRARKDVRVEIVDALGGETDRVMALYRQTLARAETRLEELTAAFFENVARRMPGRVMFALYYVGDELLAFNLLLTDGEILLDKFFGMDAVKGRAHNLYYLSWFFNLELCVAQGFKRYQSGQANLADKLRLGSRLTPSSMWFRHRNGLVNRALRALAPLLLDDPMAELAA